MRFVSFSSGSSGNCIYTGTDDTHILIDAGISSKRIEKSLSEVGLSPSDVSAICITHEHSDHIKGLEIFEKKFGIPVYATADTIKEIRKTWSDEEEFPEELFNSVMPDVDFSIGDYTVEPFSTSHDAADPVAYRFKAEGRSLAVATDMGYFNQYTIDHLLDLDAVLLESNHDVRMLETGPYPWYLKQRIMGDFGHLSNDNCGRLVNCILNERLHLILLGHLSKENNMPEIAYETVKQAVDDEESPFSSQDFYLGVAPRDVMTDIYTI